MELDVDRGRGGSAFRDAASRAIADVDTLGLKGADREIVLRSALAFHLGGGAAAPVQPQLAPQVPINAPSTADLSEPAANNGAGGGPLERIADKLGVSREVVDLVYDLEDDKLTIILSPKCVATSKANAARELAQIVAAGRQAMGLEEWTPTNVIRDVVHDYGRFDSGNFASSLTALDHNVCVFKGKQQQRSMKMTRPGFVAVGDLLRKMTEGA